ncbi:MAG: hypothetical protein A2725_04585 [Candidatus Magasanikbacteria bacterium RIFCSPHIGHO2_01_FULL_33_34]|uniref:PDZ domain-containing protein n=1 Tax=Candidatus Magasanikbacteria bacterium RIFCSPHIGHO2_01_FULL_33_34 TaxID=1798671 RepID=A0A1F6LLF5_9BACT|nr:MAG: hypothetical protein A2725_04585 [Candidatus Magasanikbacteria bacterium RIFCSPHIGHO2_01_FULL_33_34]OGH65928.1 MAG: hypothetical protein A3B83_02225 [Candidatus Magasanikbacteria bacterium RIFCSPHIGHO2_02_FULL_33_17]OGH75797.1 MAG: hypothetical protein A3A89_02665 [Candidatus Magasanikbacteria bacterium RIFCSPLOWO2_01_FULL_33_34]OGH81347.1 MAG: hypothetical protein A3F93_02185 [Candidatus Magasanikbacteria bacterium RIFCSPLOWO2_12_FULL_34_7]
MSKSDQFNPEATNTQTFTKELINTEKEQDQNIPHCVYIILEIIPGSPAEKAGLKIGDEILSIDGKPTTTVEGWFDHAHKKADQPMILKVRDNGIEKDIILTQEYLPAENRYRAGFMFQSELRPEEKIETLDLGDYIVLRYHGKMYDANGKETCSYQYDLDKDTTQRSGLNEKNQTDSVRRLRSFILQSPKEEQKKIDILARFNPKNVPVYIAQKSGTKTTGIHERNKNEVILQRPGGNFYDVHILLHELRHTQQEDNPSLHKLGSFYVNEESLKNENIDNPLIQLNPDSLVNKLKIISKLAGLNGLEKLLNDSSILKKLWNIIEEHQDKMDFGKEIPDILAVEISPGVTIKDLLMLPTRVIERDAEFGALIAERKIRQETGIDLFDLYRNYAHENKIKNHAFMILENIRSATNISEEEKIKTKNEIEKQIKELEKNGINLTLIQSVRAYMYSIGATPEIIRKYLEANEKNEA